ncbi:Rossmann-fold NAD(P)-binding domain-containing protein [Chitinophaga sancti]|uniref:N-succinylornithine carbamoyltransferase n=1 Tax=Chitinophaga sancti TaxID=1004 RepID=A0A1K1QK13_9BACT|nr:acetylornithine carbamoyltransferase [Chitinophaga sancti]WQD65200.1 acetylornithine carbamoyltransferase [Chitinophaga sancti]WQG89176.1 acetylornithine carbamoyltransferase [Chitinophaga sancti]SFW60028.1 N-succinyl-L-ornithine transcarbamylase [Chitinophaga sancti]
MKQFISVEDVPSVPRLVDIALDYKKQPFKDKKLGENKTLGMIFLNPSLRTRLSTQVAAKNLGMEAVVFNIDKEGWQLEMNDGVIMNGSTSEHVKEAAAVMGQYFDIMAIRTFPGLKDKEADYTEKYINQFIKYAGVPVVSLESATLHPLQSLTDVITIKERWNQPRRPKVVMTWAPHVKALPQAVPNSFAQWMNGWGEVDFVITHPHGYELDPKFSGSAQIEYNQDKALEGADFVYVKNWSNYNDYGKITCTDPSWMVDNAKLRGTNDAKIMHCLPVRRNVVIADEVLDGPNSIVIPEAGNRVWAAQAVLSEILKNK